MRKMAVIALTIAMSAMAVAQGIYVTPTGVGVNTASPSAKWEVYAGILGTSVGSSLNLANFVSTTANYDQLQVKSVRIGNGTSWDSSAAFIQRRVDVSDMGFIKFVDWDVALGSGTNEFLRVRNNGNVGIWMNDTARLAVHRGEANSDPTLRLNSDLGWLTFNARSPSGAWTPMAAANDKVILFTNGSPDTGDLVIGPWSGAAKGIRIVGGSGNVGVGTPNPTHKLTVAGDVRATSFISNTKTYADYVLAPDYDLAPLSEVEAHIKEKGHLPGIPSEAEAVANGIDLADMQVKLLGKVEELTLHLIALEKQVRDQQARIHELESGGN